MSEPLFSEASTTTVPNEIPLIMRFRSGKFRAMAAILGLIH